MALIWTPVFTVSLPKSSEIRFYSEAGQGLNDKHCFKKSGASLREREVIKELKPKCGAIARCRNCILRSLQKWHLCCQSSRCGSVGWEPNIVSVRMRIWSLASLSGLKDPALPQVTDAAQISHCHGCGVGGWRSGGWGAAAPLQSQAWGLLYGAAVFLFFFSFLKIKKKKKKKKKKKVLLGPGSFSQD